MKKKILTVIGTRPNYIKVTQFEKEFARHTGFFEHRLLHTGQHFDKVMKDVFFQQLGLHKIDYALDITQGSPATQIGEILCGMDGVIREWRPDLIMVVGDVNSTLAAAIAANKNQVPLAHVESGLRSFDRTMPEEYNRIITDQLAGLLFVTEASGVRNLLQEGRKPEEIHFVGNTMIDTLVAFESEFDQSPVLAQLGLREKEYVLMTIHRPSNVDQAPALQKVLEVIQLVAADFRVVFPIHPRTRKNTAAFGLQGGFDSVKNLLLTEPLDYFSFQKLIKHAAFVLTDSGGVQEETTFRRIPCLTLRENTERPVTVEMGTNELIPFDAETIREKMWAISEGTFRKGSIPPLWDGKATGRLVDVLRKIL